MSQLLIPECQNDYVRLPYALGGLVAITWICCFADDTTRKIKTKNPKIESLMLLMSKVRSFIYIQYASVKLREDVTDDYEKKMYVTQEIK